MSIRVRLGTKLFLCLVILSTLALSEVVELWEKDFIDGTYIIDKPGHYKLMEDVHFNPNSVQALGVSSYEAGDVLMSQYTYYGGKYDPAAYGVGFFAAIAIAADDVVLDLNRKSMIQSKEHALQQRFYAHIELADQPFMPTQGPHDFGETLTGAKNVLIKNGVLGRSSHHGIHGNANFNITLQDLHIFDYEVAGIALNGVRGMIVKNVHMSRCRYDIPILGLFSAGRFIRPYVNWLVSQNSTTTIRVQGETLTALDIQRELKKTLNNVFDDVITRDLGKIDQARHPVEYALFHNRRGVVDGNSYGLLLNRPGVAVNGFPFVPSDPASHVVIENVLIENHASDTHEIPALRAEDGKELVDPVGSVWQIFNLHPDTKQPITISSYDLNGKYLGNVVSNAQALIGRAVLKGEFLTSRLGTRRTKFNEKLLSWVETPDQPLSSYTDEYPVFCSGDTMFHVSKGVIGVKLDAASAVSVSNLQVKNITNYGPKGIEGICPYTKNTISNYQATTTGYGGADCRGFSFSGSVNITVRDSEVIGITAYGGSAYGFDVMTNSHDITLDNCRVDKIRAGVAYSSVSDFEHGPTRIPEAYGFHSQSNSSSVHIHEGDCDHFSAIGPAGDYLLLGKNNVVVEDDSSSSNNQSSSSGSILSATIGVLLLCVLFI